MDDQAKRKREEASMRRPQQVGAKMEQAKAAATQQVGKLSAAEIQKAKKAALAQAERTTGHYIGFDSSFGNYLLPALPQSASASK
mmetsp:Transcript_37202/g.104978  ORF Transcript_37202/g.104978 Transcript_37202/m.104978 type:complete len:85 (-) Transcript_37202:214-468(-)